MWRLRTFIYYSPAPLSHLTAEACINGTVENAKSLALRTYLRRNYKRSLLFFVFFFLDDDSNGRSSFHSRLVAEIPSTRRG